MNPIPPDLLHRLRNDLDLTKVIERLGIPAKRLGQRLAFCCPECGSDHAAVSPGYSLAHCFHCQRNFNPIDLVMAAYDYTFLEAVDFLEPLLFTR